MQNQNAASPAASFPANVTSFDRPTLAALRSVIDRHLAALAAETGLVFTIGRGSFMEGQVDYPLSIKIKGALTKDARSYNANAAYLGLPADGLGKIFKFSNGDAEVVGLNRKKVMLRKIADGSEGSYISVEMAARLFRLQHGFVNTSHAGPTAGIAGLIARNAASVA